MTAVTVWPAIGLHARWALVGVLGTLAGLGARRLVAGAAGRPPVRRRQFRVTAGALGLACGTVAGIWSALALRDPFVAGLGMAIGWGGGRLAGGLSRAHATTAETRVATRLLEQVGEEASVGMDPVGAFHRALVRLPAGDKVRRRGEALVRRVEGGEVLHEAAALWAQDESLPTLRMFGRLLAAWAVWGIDLRGGLSRVLHEARQSVAFGEEEALERRAYEWLTWLFLGADLVLGVWALASWPATVASPTRTAWGHALLILSALATVLAVSLPATLEAAPSAQEEAPGADLHPEG